jgi:hypothetical protein
MIAVKLIRHTFGVFHPRTRLTKANADDIATLLNDYETEHLRRNNVPRRDIINVTAIPDEDGITFMVIARES